ncbi:MAG: hypothetical protein A3I88_01780 [Candidatus Portnoybacteria bacterium RIFCSPLOWO2_12_FULL_39_9]|nr:MAG: hypothetical protein A2646_03070 [Candidatus Portnoybacteria bacterium RIFCSPHIGHO2_02_FULL_39_12]OGZ37810.1 MAG: hypothetical protein A3F21_02645 [Candidatus Portnoybacteria bacterium RIFCSPLOWO2_01_FULL_38_39]OGZ39771.1 MAG: hypothetical protein A3I88_01780 [Candidatus Portnoybacteria bacterium RIFCSPLOWO2_12_FULL_39_9]
MKRVKNKFKKNKSILMVIWQDAAFSYRKKFPQESIPMQITFGIFLDKTKEAIKIGMNCHLDPNNKEIIEGKDVFLIPKGVIKEIKNIGDFNG